MAWHSRFTLAQMKSMSYIAGSLLLLVHIVYYLLNNIFQKSALARKKQIATTVRIIITLPMIPYYFGVAFEERELLFPSLVGALYGIFIDVVIWAVWYKQEAASAQYDDILMTILWVSVFASALFCVIVVFMIVKLKEFVRESELREQTLGQYSLRRFDAIPITQEWEKYVLEGAEMRIDDTEAEDLE